MDPILQATAEAARGFMPPDEGLALYEAAASVPSGASPLLEIGSYCGKSAVYLGAGAQERGTILFALDHHRGSEENQPGWEWHEPDLVDPEVGLHGHAAPVPPHRPRRRARGHGGGPGGRLAHRGAPLGHPAVAAVHRRRPRRTTRPTATTRPGRRTSSPGACWSSTTCSPTRPTAAARPIEIYCRALDSGAFREERAVGSLRVLRRIGPGTLERQPEQLTAPGWAKPPRELRPRASGQS